MFSLAITIQVVCRTIQRRVRSTVVKCSHWEVCGAPGGGSGARLAQAGLCLGRTPAWT